MYMFVVESPNRPIQKTEVLATLKKLEEAGDPLVRFRIKFRTISKHWQTGPFGAQYAAHIFRPSGVGLFFRREGAASEILKKFIQTNDGVSDEIHPKNAEVIQAVRIYTLGPMGIPVDHLRYPPKSS